MRPRIDYEACTVELFLGTFQLVRLQPGQFSVVDLAHRCVAGEALIAADGRVIGSTATAEVVVMAWVDHCAARGLEPWPALVRVRMLAAS